MQGLRRVIAHAETRVKRPRARHADYRCCPAWESSTVGRQAMWYRWACNKDTWGCRIDQHEVCRRSKLIYTVSSMFNISGRYPRRHTCKSASLGAERTFQRTSSDSIVNARKVLKLDRPSNSYKPRTCPSSLAHLPCQPRVDLGVQLVSSLSYRYAISQVARHTANIVTDAA
jgi:hypothetical protein